MAWYIIESLDFEIKRNAFLYMYIFTVKAGVESVCGSGAYDSAPPPFSLGIFKGERTVTVMLLENLSDIQIQFYMNEAYQLD